MITRLRFMNIGGKGCCLKNLNNLISLNNCGTYSIQIIDYHLCTVVKEIKTEIKIIDYQFSQNGLFLVLNGGHMITIVNLISNFYRRLYNTEFVGLINNHILYIKDSYLKIEHNGVLTTSYKVYKWSRFYCLKNIYAQSLEPMRDIQFKSFKNKNIKFIYNGKTGYNILQTSQSNQFIINDVKLKRFTHIVKLRTIKQIRIIKYQQYYEEKDLTQFQVYNKYIVYPIFKFKLNLFNFISLKKESQVIFVKGKYVIQNNLKNLICLHQTVPKLSVYEIKWN